MTRDQAIRNAGSVSNLAAILGVTPAAVRNWHGDLPTHQEARLRAVRPEWFSVRITRQEMTPADRLARVEALAAEIRRVAAA